MVRDFRETIKKNQLGQFMERISGRIPKVKPRYSAKYVSNNYSEVCKMVLIELKGRTKQNIMATV